MLLVLCPLTTCGLSILPFVLLHLKQLIRYFKKLPMNEENWFHMVAPPTLKKISLYIFCYSPWFSLPSSICAFIGILLCHLLEVWKISFECNIDFDLGFFFFPPWDIYMKKESLSCFICSSCYFLSELVMMLHEGHCSWLLWNWLIINKR